MTTLETLKRAKALQAKRMSAHRRWRETVDTLWSHFGVPAHIEERRAYYDWCEAFEEYRRFLIEAGASNLGELERRVEATPSPAVTIRDDDGEAD